MSAFLHFVNFSMSRFYPFLLLLFWLASMGWLASAKLAPVMLGGTPPEYTPVPEKETPVCWRLRFNQQPIGWAASIGKPAAEGGATAASVVELKELPLKQILAGLFGQLGGLLQPLLKGAPGKVDLTLESKMVFDAKQELKSFHSVISLGDLERLIVFNGEVTPSGSLALVGKTGAKEPWEIFRDEIHLPPGALVRDGFSPDLQLAGLTVGQRWTMPVLRPFPDRSVEIIEAKAEYHDIIYWQGEAVETLCVIYRPEAGSGIHASRAPLGRVWVRADGLVLKQEMSLANLKFIFERMSPEEITLHEEVSQWLVAQEK